MLPLPRRRTRPVPAVQRPTPRSSLCPTCGRWWWRTTPSPGTCRPSRSSRPQVGRRGGGSGVWGSEGERAWLTPVANCAAGCAHPGLVPQPQPTCVPTSLAAPLPRSAARRDAVGAGVAEPAEPADHHGGAEHGPGPVRPRPLQRRLMQRAPAPGSHGLAPSQMGDRVAWEGPPLHFLFFPFHSSCNVA